MSSSNPFDVLGSGSESEDEVQATKTTKTRKFRHRVHHGGSAAPYRPNRGHGRSRGHGGRRKQQHRPTTTPAAPAPTKVLRPVDVYTYDGNAGTLMMLPDFPDLSEYSQESITDVFARLSKKARKVMKDDRVFAELALGVLQQSAKYMKTAPKAVEVVYTTFRRQFLNFAKKPREVTRPVVRIISLWGTNGDVINEILGPKGAYMVEIGEEYGCHIFFGNSNNVTSCPELMVFNIGTEDYDMVDCYNHLQDDIMEVVEDYETEFGQLDFTKEATKKEIERHRFKYQKGSKHWKAKQRRSGKKQ